MARKLLPLVKIKQKNGSAQIGKGSASGYASPVRSLDDVLNNSSVVEAMRRAIIEIEDGEVITYHLNHERTYKLKDPEEWVRAVTVAWLVVERDYPANRIRLEVVVPRRMPND